MVLTGTTTAGAVTGIPELIITVQSREIIFAAQPLLRFDQFAEEKTELGVAPGLTITMTKYASLTGGGELTEGTAMVPVGLSASQISITVHEQGNAVRLTEKLLQASFSDQMADASKLLGYNYASVSDGQLRDVLMGGGNVIYGGGVASRAALGASDKMDVRAIKDAVENLAINKAPKINADFYVCFVHPHQSRSLRDDPAWINAANYGATRQLFNGEIGRIEDTIFIETTMVRDIRVTGDIYADNVDTGVDVAPPPVRTYQAVIVGDNAYGRAFALPVEMRDNGVLDHGREHGLAWYAIYGQGLIETAHSYLIETA